MTPSSSTEGQSLTAHQFASIKALCLDIYTKKLTDYGTSWRLMRLPSLTDQILIKARRIRTIEETGVNLIGEGVIPEFIGIINYSVIALIQAAVPASQQLSANRAIELYNVKFDEATHLMTNKNHDYGEVWREMRVSSFTDIILTKLQRIKQIEDNDGATLISEGVEAGYMDIINYGVFALIKSGCADEK